MPVQRSPTRVDATKMTMRIVQSRITQTVPRTLAITSRSYGKRAPDRSSRPASETLNRRDDRQARSEDGRTRHDPSEGAHPGPPPTNDPAARLSRTRPLSRPAGDATTRVMPTAAWVRIPVVSAHPAGQVDAPGAHPVEIDHLTGSFALSARRPVEMAHLVGAGHGPVAPSLASAREVG